jgi:hypothetical protein
MGWGITIDGHRMESDDFLLDDLATVEKSTGTPWSLANPWKDVAVAKAFARVVLIHSGLSVEEADERLKSLTLRDVKSAFEFIDDNEGSLPAGGQKGKSRTTSRSTSGGARSGSAGPRGKSGSSD